MKLTNGVKVTNLTTEKMPKNLPRMMRQSVQDRGYGDATQTLSLFVQEGDIGEAFDCAARGNGSMCVMAQAGMRIGAKAVYFYRTTAWVDFGSGPIVRFQTSKAIYNNVIGPFDRGSRDEVEPGIYHLTPPSASKALGKDRDREPRRQGQKADGSKSPVAHSHTERVVMAART